MLIPNTVYAASTGWVSPSKREMGSGVADTIKINPAYKRDAAYRKTNDINFFGIADYLTIVNNLQMNNSLNLRQVCKPLECNADGQMAETEIVNHTQTVYPGSIGSFTAHHHPRGT